ncbi:cytochrome P450 89A2-like [Cornus florida]|uniref:cytochrome P450 89A2-like n=1 Tax=Cornus florida TaxID=4283 RepID=UPI0028A2990F|nr:cytochrome P450 89A2-like [Cornus florida]
MEFWFLLFASLCIYISLSSLLGFLRTKRLPPGPPTIPFLGNLLWLLQSSSDFSTIEPTLRRLRARYGPIVTLYIGSFPAIFVTTHEAAHRVLVQGGATFANRPQALETSKILFSNQHTLSSAAYGPLWRLLRRNFTSIFHPSRVKLYSHGRKWALDMLKTNLQTEAASGKAVLIWDHIQHAMFSLVVFMCFGEKLKENVVREIEKVQRTMIVNFIRFNVLNFMPKLGKIVFRKLWKEFLEMHQNQENVLLPLIRERVRKRKEASKDKDFLVISYIDSLFDLQLPQEGRKFSESEIVSLCSEFLNAGTDTTTTTLQWAMANIVKHQGIQQKLYSEINRVVKKGEEIKEDDLDKMHYLKATVLETLRRHPPGHFILPRAATGDDAVFDGYHIPRNAIVNFTVADMGWDPNVWEEPMEFKPERFLKGDGGEVAFDVKGVKEIKMMPFGAGRRVCPAIHVALLHVQYFVANLVREFKWTAEDVDLSEKQDFSIVMKNPLRAHVTPRMD